MSTLLTQLEALRTSRTHRSSHSSGPAAAGPWHVRICDRQGLSDRFACMPELTFLPEVNA